MRVLAVAPGPEFSVQDVHNGWMAGLRAHGVQVAEYNLNARLTFYSAALIDRGNGPERALNGDEVYQLAGNGLLSACYQIQPDVLLVTSGFFLGWDMLDLIRSRGTKVVLIHTEEPYEHDREIIRAHHADVNIINDPLLLEKFPAPAWYQPHCYQPDLHHPGDVAPDFRSEFCFVGTGYPSRIEWFERVDWTGIDVALAGNWQALDDDSPLRKFVAHPIENCCDNTEAADLYRGGKVSVNLYRQEAADGRADGIAMGPREVEMAACGLFFLRDPRPESDTVLSMLPTLTDPDGFGEQVRWWLDHDTQRQQAATKARQAVADRTFTNAAARLLRHLDT